MLWWHDGWMWLGGIFGFLLLIGFIVLVVWLATRNWGASGTSSGEGKNNALDIAKERYAKGEISHEEFEKIKKNLLT